MTTVKKKVVKKIATKKTDVKNSTSQPPKRRIVKVNTEQIQDIFIDGMSNLSVGEVVKITFYSVISSSETEIIRKPAFRLVMEHRVMIDMVVKLKGSILRNADKLSSVLDTHKKEILTLVDNLKGK